MTEHKVPSKTNPDKNYIVTDLDTSYECTCPAFQFKHKCSHIEIVKKKNSTPAKPVRPEPTNNRSLDNYLNRNTK